MPCYICSTPEIAGNRAGHEICRRCLPQANRRHNKVRGKSNREVPVPTPQQWLDLLRHAWDARSQVFRCQLSGLPLNLEDNKGPLYPSLDHDRPGQPEWRVVAWVINDMKNDHTGAEFLRNIRHLARILENDQPNAERADKCARFFSRAPDGIQYWKR